MNERLEHIFVAFVSFEGVGDLLGILPGNCHGASGWMAIKATDEERVVNVLGDELAQIELKLVEADRVAQVYSVEQIARYDEHLASNVAQWQAGKATVWGTIHAYLAEGAS